MSFLPKTNHREADWVSLTSLITNTKIKSYVRLPEAEQHILPGRLLYFESREEMGTG